MRILLSLMLILGLLAAAIVGGFAVRHYEIGAFTSLVERVERKVNELRGAPSEWDIAFDLIETTNVRLRGTVYEIPRDEFASGGALAVWGQDLLVMDRLGTIRRLVEGQGIVPTGIGVPDNGRTAYEAVAAAPAYAGYAHRPDRHRYNDLVHVDGPALHGLALSYSYFDAEQVCYSSRVAWIDVPRGTAPADFTAAPEDWEMIYETAPCLPLNPTWTAFDGIMAGGRMAFDGGTTLYFGSGEYHLDGVHTYDVGIQSPDTDYGKVIAIDIATGQSRHVSIGHRNMQGVAIDAAGRLWTTEHMIRGGDELNLIVEGGNYGWPLETYGTLYSGLPFPNWGEEGRHVLHTSPAFAWLPSPGISTLGAIEGFHPAWDGDLLAGSLSSPAHGQSLFRIRIEGDRAIFAERIRMNQRIRYVTQWGPDRIAVLFDRNRVVVFRAEVRVDVLGRALELARKRIPSDIHTQVAQIARSCSECHSFERDVSGAAPSLAGVIGRPVGGGFYDNYSDALLAHGGVWDRALLTAYLDNPPATIPGTAMPDPNLAPGPVMDGLLDLLEIVGQEAEGDLPYN